MTGAEMVELFERFGVRRTEITTEMMHAVDDYVKGIEKAERLVCWEQIDELLRTSPARERDGLLLARDAVHPDNQ